MTDKFHPAPPAPAAQGSPLVAFPKAAEAALAAKVPEHFFLDEKTNRLRVRFDQLTIRKDPEHKGQCLVDVYHGGQLLVTQMVPDGFLDGGVLVLHGIEGSSGVSIEQG